VTASVAHVLSMTLGTAWDELTFPYSDPRNSEIQMDAAPDRYRFILERPVVSEPGVKWTYCGGATALLGRVIAKGTGQSLPDFARRAMFEPLGLGPTDWTTGRDGEPLAASGLRMRAPDLLRVGQMVLGSGLWQGRQIVSAEWLKLSTEPVVEIDETLRLALVSRRVFRRHVRCGARYCGHRLGRAAALRVSLAGSRYRDECRKLPTDRNRAGAYCRNRDDRGCTAMDSRRRMKWSETEPTLHPWFW